MTYMRALTDWLQGHPLVYPFILFLIGTAASVYSQNIKRFLHEWPRAKEKARQARRNAATRRLELLRRLHNNSYELIIYLANRLVGMVYGLIVIVVFVGVAKAIHKWEGLAGVLTGLLSGQFIGALQNLREVFVQLNRYEQSVSQLQQALSDLEEGKG